MNLCEYLEQLYYRIRYFYTPRYLERSPEWEAKVKELLLEDLKTMKYAKVIECEC